MFSSLKNIKNKFRKKIKGDDVIFFDFQSENVKGFLIYVDSIIDRENLGELVLKPLNVLEGKIDENIVRQTIKNANVSLSEDFNETVEKILNGNVCLFIENCKKAILVDLRKYEVRAVAEPPTSCVIKGPREGFNESIKTNLSLIRRRVKNPDLTVQYFTLGRQSKTNVAIAYLENIASDEIVEEVKKRLNKIDIDNIPDSSYVAKLICDNKNSLFHQTGSTEKPDVLCAKMMEGRIAVIVDGSPIVITVPYLFIEDFQNSEDYFKSDFKANMERMLRIIALIVAVYLPCIYVASQLYHLEFIPLKFLITVVNSVKGIPLSPGYEMFFTLLIFEILNQASVRMPKYVGMALSVVGALVLGETAVNAGIVSSPTILIMALSGICLYSVPELVDSLAVLRFGLLVVAGTFGGFGIITASSFILIYLASLESFTVPFLSPYAPFLPQDLKDGIIMDRIDKMEDRPLSLKPKNKTRIKVNEKN